MINWDEFEHIHVIKKLKQILNSWWNIDVVFTDIRLTGDVNGWDIGEAARAVRGDIPVIYASGYSIAPPRQVSGSLFFSKPDDPEAVLKACRALGRAH